MNSISKRLLEDMSEIIGAIYDCALDPELWRTTLPRILSFSLSPCGALAIHDCIGGRSGRLFDHGYDESYIKLYFDKYEQMNPLATAMQTLEVGDVVTTGMLVDDREFFDSRFYKEFLKPFRLCDAITAIVLRSDHRIAMLFGNRFEDQPRYDKDDLDRFRLLGLHVCRALAISDALDLRTLSSKALEAALDALTVGIYLLDREDRIVHINRTGELQLKSGSALRVANRRLTATNPAAQDALGRELEAVGKPLETTGGHAIALPGMRDVGYVAYVLPLDAGERRRLLAPYSAVTAVFVQDPAIVPPLPGEAFAKLYGLTAAELRVLLVLSPGLSVKEAAEILGIGETTAKTHLMHIFAKTSTSKQTELLRLLMSTAPPIV